MWSWSKFTFYIKLSAPYKVFALKRCQDVGTNVSQRIYKYKNEKIN